MLSDDEFLSLVDKYNYVYTQGQIVTGTVAGFDNNNIIVDINTKAYALCPYYEVLVGENCDIKQMFQMGETYEFVINSLEDEDGIFYLSHKKVALKYNLDIIREKFNNNEVVKGKITALTKGGVIVSVMGIKGFVPLSQLKVSDEHVGMELELKVLTLDLPKGDFVLSNKKVYSDNLDNVRKEIFDKIELNMVVKGTVVRITDFGAFVDIGGVDGLLPLSQISWKWIDNPADVLECSQKIDVEIIGIDKDKQRISLSLKSLEQNPWLLAQDSVCDNKIVKGKVTSVKHFGAFVEVYPKVEGLLNKYQIQKYYEKYKNALKENDEIDVLIKRFDVENQKINLEIV